MGTCLRVPRKRWGKFSEKQLRYKNAVLVLENSELFKNSPPDQQEGQWLPQLTVGRTNHVAEARRKQL